MKNTKLSLVIIAFFLIASFPPFLWGRSPSDQTGPLKPNSSVNQSYTTHTSSYSNYDVTDPHSNKEDYNQASAVHSTTFPYDVTDPHSNIEGYSQATGSVQSTTYSQSEILDLIDILGLTDLQISQILSKQLSKQDFLSYLESYLESLQLSGFESLESPESDSEESESTSWDTTLTLSVATELLNGSTYSGSDYLTAEFFLKGTSVIKLNCDTFTPNTSVTNRDRGTAKCTTTDIGNFDYADFDSISLVATGSLEVQIYNYIVSISKEPSEITQYACLPGTATDPDNDCTPADKLDISMD